MLNYFTEGTKFKLPLIFLLISQYSIPQATMHRTLNGEVAE